jgi:LuxR family maltose regulon positive regulatory protein
VRRLLEARHLPVALLLAPAGYGKTALLRQWADCDERPFAWVTVDEGDNDPRALLSAVALALDAVEPLGSDVLDSLSARRRERTAVAQRRLTAAIARRQVPAVLVVDDLHVLHAEAARAAIVAIARACGDTLQLAIGARSDVGIPTARMRLHGSSLELRAHDLAMTRSEATGALRRAELECTAEQALELHARTEGWPAGLQLGALLSQEREVLRGDDRVIANYVREEMLAGLDPDERELVIATSVLDRITAPACNALLDRDDAAGMLARLSRGDVMLVPLDRTDGSYRYQRLFAEALRAELRRLGPERERELHTRASAWYAGNGDAERAIGHAIEAGDNGQAASLLWKCAPAHLGRGGQVAIGGWLDRFSPAAVAGNALLCLVAAARALAAGNFDESQRWTTLARHAPGDDVARGGVALMQAGNARHGVAQLGGHAETAAELLGEASPWHTLSLLYRGVAATLRNDAGNARVLLEEGAHLSAVQAPLVQVLCLAQLTLLAEADDDVERAAALAARARAQVGRCDLDDCPTTALVFAASAGLRARTGHADEASADLRRALQLLAQMTDPASWFELECLILAARTTLALRGPAAAREHVARAERAAPRLPDAPFLHGWLDRTRADLESALDSSQGAEWTLTAAELRVLRHLPSHLSFREIADRLYVSQNTVKTHARGIYRKLGVTSRGDAVELARGAGLVERTAGA